MRIINHHTPLYADIPVHYTMSYQAKFPRLIFERMLFQMKDKTYEIAHIPGLQMCGIRRTNYGLSFNLLVQPHVEEVVLNLLSIPTQILLPRGPISMNFDPDDGCYFPSQDFKVDDFSFFNSPSALRR